MLSLQDCISMVLSERVTANWGFMVRQWTQKHGGWNQRMICMQLLF